MFTNTASYNLLELEKQILAVNFLGTRAARNAQDRDKWKSVVCGLYPEKGIDDDEYLKRVKFRQ